MNSKEMGKKLTKIWFIMIIISGISEVFWLGRGIFFDFSRYAEITKISADFAPFILAFYFLLSLIIIFGYLRNRQLFFYTTIIYLGSAAILSLLYVLQGNYFQLIGVGTYLIGFIVVIYLKASFLSK